ncbi:MAG: DUF177 domain-containing protein [Anaerolineae bacterium]|nr:DUF177 domain-containing protein [Anaerolineae bacterium]
MHKNRVKHPWHGLEFNVAQLLKEATGAVRTYEVEIDLQGDFDDEEVKIVGPLTGQVRFLRTGPNILATGELQTTIEKNCGRCLTSFTAPVAVELEEEFFPTLDIITGAAITQPPEIEEANLIDEQHILDLSEVVRQELLVAGGPQLYCRPDCKGLCPHCGQDLNTGSCNCQDDVVDPRWAGLQTLLED